MPDTPTVAVPRSAATEGVRFLYGQGSVVIAAWRERRQQEDAAIRDTCSLRAPKQVVAFLRDVLLLLTCSISEVTS